MPEHTENINRSARYSRPERFQILGIDIDNASMKEALHEIFSAVVSGNKASFAFVNADCLNIVHGNLAYDYVLGRQKAVFADGSGVRVAARMQGKHFRENVNGTDMFPLLCEQAAERGASIFLLGGREGVAAKAAKTMQDAYPGLKIAGTRHGFFLPEEEPDCIQQINDSQADILLVAFGVPRQEFWIDRNRYWLTPSVCIGVGGLFDFYSGRIPRAPLFLRRYGCEWMWRLAQEPSRLWRRYVIGNPLLILRCGSEYLFGPKRMRSPASPYRIFYAKMRRRLWQIHQSAVAEVKRGIDIAVAATALAFLSPLFLIAALAIRLESAGPAVFIQTRVGMNGRRFKIWKFRSMYVDAEERRKALLATSDREGSHFKMKRDPRITRVGRIIRRLSIDELPQLWNVLNGTMSLVGPRPNLESEVRQYRLHELGRLAVRPGITCFWQVQGRAELPWARQVELDLDYVHQRSFKTDVRLLLKTIPAVLTGRGAY